MSASRAARRASSSARVRRSSRRCAALGLICVDEEHDASYKQESDPRYDARTVAAKRAALEGAVAVYGSATPRPESWERLERIELGGRLGGPAAAGAGRRPAPRGRLSALGAAARRAREGRRERRQGDPAPEPPRRRARAALPRLRHDAPLPELRRRARAPPRRAASLPPLRPLEPAPERVPRLRLHRARADRRRDAAPRARAGGEGARARADPPRRRHGRASRGAGRGAAALPPRPTAPCSSARRWWRRATTSPGVALAAVVDADTGLGLPDFRAEERTFQLVTQLAGRSGRDAPGGDRADASSRTRGRSSSPRATTSPRFLADELARRAELGYPPFRHLVRVVVSGPDAGAPRGAARRSSSAGPRRATLLGPAPLLRLRGRHRAQLVAKTDEPRRCRRARGAAARRGRSRDAEGEADRGRGRGPTEPSET